MKSKEKLKPCGLCGRKVQIKTFHQCREAITTSYYYAFSEIVCDCGLILRTTLSEDALIRKWNRRVE